MQELQRHLVAYGVHLLAAQLGRDKPGLNDPIPPAGSLAQEALNRLNSYNDERLQLARKIIYDAGLKQFDQPQPLTPIFSLLRPRSSSPGLPYIQESTPSLSQPDIGATEATALWTDFWDKLTQLTPDHEFDTFFYLMARYGRDVAGTIADPARSGFETGLSVFEQFKVVAALCHCLDPALAETQPLGLVMGDLPGIQRTLYTLTSRGAAKTLRGRSAYLQLLGDAIIRYLVRHLGLSWANVVFCAGGNFMLLTRGQQETEIQRLADDINRKLLDLHRAELHLALAQTQIEARLVADTSHRLEPGTLSYARQMLYRRLAAAKDEAFATLLDKTEAYNPLFSVFGQGGPAFISGQDSNLCAICHVEGSQANHTLIPIRADDQPVETGVAPEIEMALCEQCHSLGSHRVQEDHRQEILPYQLAHAEALFVELIEPCSLPGKYLQPNGGQGNPSWDSALESLGFRYSFRWPGKKPQLESLKGKHGYLLYLNRDQFTVGKEPQIAYGFWPLTRLTPWQNDEQDTIRDFSTMARYDTSGLPRYGVLRMDVDNLGQTLRGHDLTYPDLLHLSALSAALNVFFSEQLAPICRKAKTSWADTLGQLASPTTLPDYISTLDRKLPYVIYAGGDDLFIVGPWDILPPLAQSIRLAFDAYSHQRLTMSAGISLASEKYPLYKAAEDAGSALDESKSQPGKDRLTFLGKTLPWADSAQAQETALKLAQMIELGEIEGDKIVCAPHALLSVLGYIAYLYHQGTGPELSSNTEAVSLGRWLWALHYGLRRLGRRVKSEKLKQKIYALVGNDILNINDLAAARAFRPIRWLDLSVRWAEYLIRKGENGP